MTMEICYTIATGVTMLNDPILLFFFITNGILIKYTLKIVLLDIWQRHFCAEIEVTNILVQYYKYIEL